MSHHTAQPKGHRSVGPPAPAQTHPLTVLTPFPCSRRETPLCSPPRAHIQTLAAGSLQLHRGECFRCLINAPCFLLMLLLCVKRGIKPCSPSRGTPDGFCPAGITRFATSVLVCAPGAARATPTEPRVFKGWFFFSEHPCGASIQRLGALGCCQITPVLK